MSDEANNETGAGKYVQLTALAQGLERSGQPLPRRAQPRSLTIPRKRAPPLSLAHIPRSASRRARLPRVRQSVQAVFAATSFRARRGRWAAGMRLGRDWQA
jgi:hypothetical protein